MRGWGNRGVPTETAVRLDEAYWGFRKWKEHDEYQKEFGRLMRDLKAEERKPD
jgi:hypothetical protein